MTTINTRTDWGAKAPKYRTRLNPSAVKHIAIHHPGSAGTLAGKAVAALLRGWQLFHMATRKWSDIAYNEAVDQAGNVWLCRGDYADGSVKNMGGRVYSILAVLGNSEKPTAAMLDAIARRVEYHAGRFPDAKVVGHRDLVQTACPGAELHAWIHDGMPVDGLEPETPGEPETPTPLTVSGVLDAATIRRWQEVVGTVADGRVDRPSALVAEVQRRLNASPNGRDRYGNRLVVDGVGLQSNKGRRWPAVGTTRTVWALQRYLGITPDGYLSPKSDTIKALQRRLNNGTF